MDVAQALRIWRQIVRNLFAHEVLDEAPASDPEPAAQERTSLAEALFARESLGSDAEPPRETSPRLTFWRALLSPEALGVDPEPAPATARRRTLVQALFAPEPLPEDPPAPRRPARARWSRWLFVPESLDPPR